MFKELLEKQMQVYIKKIITLTKLSFFLSVNDNTINSEKCCCNYFFKEHVIWSQKYGEDIW